MKHCMILIAFLTLALPSVAQQAPDPETRFHDAYLAEVVEGKTAEAARAYYELMEAEGVPDRIRRESRFRFAVCCVLLGRADEGRARLAELASDPDLGAAMRARVEEYLKAVQGIGAGTEVEKRLEDLVFELGRTKLGESGKVYRDFQIIGRPAVPFLKRLLTHSDPTIRLHAFRILCLLDVPGMAAVWDPLRPEGYTGQYFGPYLKKHPEELRRVEARLLELEGEEFAETIERNFGVLTAASPLSEELLRALASRPGQEGRAFTLYSNQHHVDDELLSEWLESEYPALSIRAARLLTKIHESDARDDTIEPALLPLLVERLLGDALSWRAWKLPNGQTSKLSSRVPGAESVPDSRAGLTRYALRNRASVVEGILAKLVAQGESWEGDPWTNPLFTGLADALALSLDERDPKEVDLPSYLALLKRWIKVHEDVDPAKWIERQMYYAWPDSTFRKHLANVLEHSDRETAESFVRWIYSRPGSKAEPYTYLFRVETRRDLDLLALAVSTLAEFEGTEGSLQELLMRSLPFFQGPEKTPERLVAPQADFLAGLIGTSGFGVDNRIVGMLWRHLEALPAEDDARRVLRKAAAGIPRSVERFRPQILQNLFARSIRGGPEVARYRRAVAVPALPEVWADADATLRPVLLDLALEFLKEDFEQRLVLGDALPMLAKFIREHYDDLKPFYFQLLARYPDQFPLAEWVPVAPSSVWTVPSVRAALGDRAAPVARELIERPEQVNASVLAFIQIAVTPDEVRREIEEKLLQTCSPPVIREIARSLQASPREISVTRLEKTLDSLLEEKDAPLGAITELAKVLVEAGPSEKLFPAVRRMLDSDDDHDVEAGIVIAKQLGRGDLVPDLVKLLDSMDLGRREMARDAIDSILELKRIREEARARAKQEDE